MNFLNFGRISIVDDVATNSNHFSSSNSLTLFPSSGCQFGTPCHFPLIGGMVFDLNLRMSSIGTTKKGARGWSKMGPIWSKIGPNWGLFWVLSFMKIPLVSPSLDKQEQKCFGPPNFIAQLCL